MADAYCGLGGDVDGEQRDEANLCADPYCTHNDQ